MWGRYTVAKLCVMARWQGKESTLHVLLRLVVLPLPTLAMVLLLGAMPLNSPLLGVRENPVYFLQSILSFGCMTFGLLLFIRAALQWRADEYPLWIAVLISFTTVTCNEAIWMALAWFWTFPVPFRAVLGAVPHSMWFVYFHRLFLGPLVRRQHRRIRSYALLYIVQTVCTLFMFVAIALVFRKAAKIAQVVLLLCLPWIKIGLRRMTLRFASKLQDPSTEMSICPIEVFGSLYQHVCLQHLGSPIVAAAMAGMEYVASWALTPVLQCASSDEGPVMTQAMNLVNYGALAHLHEVARCTKESLELSDERAFFTFERLVPGTAMRSEQVAAKKESNEEENNDMVERLEGHLALLFQLENEVCIKYMQVAVSAVYSCYALAMYYLPHRHYDLQLMELTFPEFMAGWMACLTCALVLTCLFAIRMTWLARRYQIQSWRLLSFGLHCLDHSFHGKLLSSFVLIFNLHTLHHGVDLSMKFDWEAMIHQGYDN